MSSTPLGSVFSLGLWIMVKRAQLAAPRLLSLRTTSTNAQKNHSNHRDNDCKRPTNPTAAPGAAFISLSFAVRTAKDRLDRTLFNPFTWARSVDNFLVKTATFISLGSFSALISQALAIASLFLDLGPLLAPLSEHPEGVLHTGETQPGRYRETLLLEGERVRSLGVDAEEATTGDNHTPPLSKPAFSGYEPPRTSWCNC